MLLLQYDAEKDLIDLRHYKIVVRPVGINRAIKKVIVSKKVPQLSRLQDVSDYVLGTGAMSDSEGDELTEAQVALPDHYAGPGNRRATNESQRSAVRMRELGPRFVRALASLTRCCWPD